MISLSQMIDGVALWAEYVQRHEALDEQHHAQFTEEQRAAHRRLSRLAMLPPIWSDMPAELRSIVERIMDCDAEAYRSLAEYRAAMNPHD